MHFSDMLDLTRTHDCFLQSASAFTFEIISQPAADVFNPIFRFTVYTFKALDFYFRFQWRDWCEYIAYATWKPIQEIWSTTEKQLKRFRYFPIHPIWMAHLNCVITQQVRNAVVSVNGFFLFCLLRRHLIGAMVLDKRSVQLEYVSVFRSILMLFNVSKGKLKHEPL